MHNRLIWPVLEETRRANVGLLQPCLHSCLVPHRAIHWPNSTEMSSAWHIQYACGTLITHLPCCSQRCHWAWQVQRVRGILIAHAPCCSQRYHRAWHVQLARRCQPCSPQRLRVGQIWHQEGTADTQHHARAWLLQLRQGEFAEHSLVRSEEVTKKRLQIRSITLGQAVTTTQQPVL